MKKQSVIDINMISFMFDSVDRFKSSVIITHIYQKAGIQCHGCKNTFSDKKFISDSLYLSVRIICPSCKKTINPRLGTPLYGTHWSPEDFVKFMIMHQLERSTEEISEVLDKTTRAVRDMAERIALIDAKLADKTSPIPG